jgi:hypothetical protein
VIRKNFTFLFSVLFVIFITLTNGCDSNSSNNIAVSNSAQNGNAVNSASIPSENNTAVNNSQNSVTTNIQVSTENVEVKKIPMQTDSVPQSTPKQIAPDNSEITSMLGENFVQTRTFKNNPQLLKVEVTMLSNENNRKVTKVYLKNGKIKEISEGKIADPMTESADNILKAAQ